MLAVAASVSATAPQRAVLKQVRVPHPYYWREMYVPQVTSGPAAASWSPDGKELVYAMQGSLWRQGLGSDEARQLTAGPGYDHQPDWSPDGRRIVYASYRGDALELRMLDLTTGEDTALVSNGAVNVRWVDRVTAAASAHTGWNTAAEREAALAQLARAREVYAALAR